MQTSIQFKAGEWLTGTEDKTLDRAVLGGIVKEVQQGSLRHVLHIESSNKRNGIAVAKTVLGRVASRSNARDNVWR